MAVLGGRKLISRICRPLSRALPRIPHRSSAWPHDNLLVGRGANALLPPFFISTVTTATQSVSPDENPYLPPHLHRPTAPLLRKISFSAPEVVSGHPACDGPVSTESRVVRAEEAENSEIKQVKSWPAAGVAEGTIKSNIENRESATNTETEPPPTAAAEHTRPLQEQHSQDEPELSLEEIKLRRAQFNDTDDVPLTNRVHLIGFTSQAKFVAHALASQRGVPLHIIAHHRKVITLWGEEHRKFSLYDNGGKYVSSVPVPCPEPIEAHPQYLKPLKDEDFLDNIILDTRTTAVLPTLATLARRIDRTTTICLLHPGLGLVERLYEEIFTDPLQRPNFILGLSTHKIAKVSSDVYSVKQKVPGQLYLHGAPKFDEPELNTSPLALDGIQRSQHFVNLLASATTLNAVGLPWVRFLSWKLPMVIFSSVADTISVILGCKYNQIYPNPHAQAMWDNILDETLAIVAELPELHEVPHRRDVFAQDSFRRKLQRYLQAHGTSISPWINYVRMGSQPPIDYFNGYFVRRAKELGLNHKHNTMAVTLVKARARARQTEIRVDLLGSSPYMMDGDAIRWEVPLLTLEEELDLDAEED
ncbi:hypothetical protein F4825DRAFT_468618 [Nemania diffusa]|nr:hypothetical protein F4825DRAFT_468618 [Nemania diffusa]